MNFQAVASPMRESTRYCCLSHISNDFARMTKEPTTSTFRDEGQERKRARVERGAVDVPEDPGKRDDEQVAVLRHVDVSGGYMKENQHEEEIMRDIQVSKRGSEAASEEQPHRLRKNVRSEHEAPNASASSDPYVALKYPASGETGSRPGSELVQMSGHLNTFLRWMTCTTRMGERGVT